MFAKGEEQNQQRETFAFQASENVSKYEFKKKKRAIEMSRQCNFNLKITKAYKWIIMFLQ